jgi:hypothetical protein
MGAWHDNVLHSDAIGSPFQDDLALEAHVVVNVFSYSASMMYEANSYAMAQFSVAKSFLNSMVKPSVHLDNSKFFTCSVIMTPSMLYELVGEKVCLSSFKK